MKTWIAVIIITVFSEDVVAQNLDFEQGLAGWHTTGKVSIDKANQHKGNSCVRIETGSVYKTIPVKQLAVVQFDACAKSSATGVKAYSFVRFYDAKHQQLLEFKSKALDSTGYQQTGNYVESPALSNYMEIGIEKPGNTGTVYADDFSIDPNIGSPKTKHQPLIDLDQYMKPFWRSDTIYNETVLLYSKSGSRAAGELLYQPDKILSVKSFDLKNTYSEDKDYLRSGNVIIRAAGSAMSSRADTSFDTKNDLAWFNTESQWVVVTYTHHDNWNGPVPTYKGGQMPRTIAKLLSKTPLTIVAYGMSITRGMDVSAYDTIPPYMPTYVDLFARQLGKANHNPNIRLYNAGLPGSRVDWGAQYADKYVNPLKPDLVILDFGMNDFWSFTPEQFKGYMETMMRKIRASNPNVEFILLSNMKFDPDYVLDSDKYKSFYTGNLEGYSHVLQALQTKSVVNADMYAISSYIYDQKKAKDCIANPLHPNDYLARWYAQVLSALLIK